MVMRKTLAFIIPVQLSDDGMLCIKNIRGLKELLVYLKEHYEITLVIQSYRDKTVPTLEELGVSILYDRSRQREEKFLERSRFQMNYLKWSGRNVACAERYDCLIAWDGCSPWCLATALNCLKADRRILWLHDDPTSYLMSTDHSFYFDREEQFDSIIMPDEKIERSLLNICGNSPVRSDYDLLQLPVDVSWYRKQSEQPAEVAFCAEEINLLAISRMSEKNDLERLPGKMAQMRTKYPSLHCYMIGDGERLDHYIQQVAIHDVDSVFSLLGTEENPYPYLSACDALITSEREKVAEVETAAVVFGIPIVPLEEVSQTVWKKNYRSCERLDYVWQDGEKLVDILEGARGR